MSKAIKSGSDDEVENRSPAQVIPRYVDTSLKVGGYPVKKYLVAFVPGGIAALLALLTVALDGPLWLAGVFVLSVPMLVVGCALAVVRSQWYTSPRESVRNWWRHRKQRRSLPWQYSETVAQNLAGVSDIYDDGTARMADGRVVGLVAMGGRSTDRLPAKDCNELVNQLGGAIDEQIKSFGFRWYTTTLHRSDISSLIDQYRDVADSQRFEGSAWRYLRVACRALADWRERVEDPAWDAPERRHYVVVEATADDASSLPDPSMLDRLSPFRSPEDVSERQRRRAAQRELHSRLSDVESALASVDGLSGQAVTPDEHAQVLLNYWTGENHPPDGNLQRALQQDHTGPTVWPPSRQQQTPDDSGPVPADERGDDPGAPGNRTARERLFGLFDASPHLEAEGVAGPNEESESPAQRLLAPGIYDVTRDYVRVGDQLCRTYWIAEWPEEPDSLYWKSIYTLFGAELDGDLDPGLETPVDMDVCHHVEPADRSVVMKELQKQWGSIGAESMQRSEDGGDVTAIGVADDQDAYTQMYELLRTTNVQPWRVSSFVTVRAGQKQAIEQFEDMLRDYASLDAAKLDALHERSEQITDRLEGAPTNCTPVMAGDMDLHHAAFESCSPTGQNAFAKAGNRELKTQWMLGDSVAALFPACAESIHEEDGIEWGRNEENGRELKADPYARGLAPHIITIGTSRSGKTYSVQKGCLRWYAEDEDRTLIVLDTQGGFDGLTKVLNGKHIVLGGNRAVNPFHTEAPPDYMSHTGGQMSPFKMKTDSIVHFIEALIESQGRDPAPFHNTIEQLARQTLIDAGADPGDPSTLNEADATMRDFIEKSGEALDQPSLLTLGTHEKELGDKQDVVAALRDALSSFQEGGTYEYLLDEDATGLMDDDVDMAYLDLRQFRSSDTAEKSAMFRLMLDQVNQKIKRTGETMFVIDEAHFLLHSEEMVNWLQKASREWARYDACLWFASQSPGEFITQTTGGTGENKRRTIYEQCSTVQFFRTKDLDDDEEEVLSKFGLNDMQIEHVRKRATPGWAGEGYTQSLIQFDDRPDSWYPLRVEASPVEDAIFEYKARDHGDFSAYMQRECGIEAPTDEEFGWTAADAEALAAAADGDGEQFAREVASVLDGTSPTPKPKPEPEPVAGDGGAVAVDDLDGIGPTYAERLRADGIASSEELLAMDASEVATVADTAESRADRWQENARQRVNGGRA